MKHDKPDLDTETGLPRPAAGKLARWCLVGLLTVAVWYLNDIRGDLKEIRADVVELKIEIAALKAVRTVAVAPHQTNQAP